MDGSGNVFVADSNNAADINNVRVRDFQRGRLSTSCMITLGSGFSGPSGVAVDASGNVFVADTLNNAVKEILAAGATPRSTRWAAASTIPMACRGRERERLRRRFASNNRVVKLDFADSPSLSFGSINVGANSAEQTVTLQNIGNVPLTLPFPTAGSNPSVSQYFALDSSASTACPIVTHIGSGKLGLRRFVHSLHRLRSNRLGQYQRVGGADGQCAERGIAELHYTDDCVAGHWHRPAIADDQLSESGNPDLRCSTNVDRNCVFWASDYLHGDLGACNRDGGTLTFTGIGSVTIQANQPGNAAYLAAAPVSVTFVGDQG